MNRPGTPIDPAPLGRQRPWGFTLVELMITLTILGFVMVILMGILFAAQRSKTATQNQIESAQAGRVALDLMARDLRSAGYGADLYHLAQPQPPVAYIDSLQVLINANFQPYPDDTIPRPPLAYNPAGAPRPFPLDGTAWQPPIKYRRGAEVVRWTLDLNNDGQVNASDVAHANGLDAQRTPNPNDYVLVRQVYGDSTGNVAGNNGGQLERIALIRRPGGGVPPLFQVYLEGRTTPWDWSGGPIPPGRLSEIQRIVIQVAAASGRPDAKGAYAETRMQTEVNSIRNVPNFGRVEYAVDGYVFNDLNRNTTKQANEPGLAGATVRLGRYSTVTSSTGYFILKAPAGTYTLRHVPPPGYGVFTSPDSVVLTLGPAASFSFADTAKAGGWVKAFVYQDTNLNGYQDAGEAPYSGIKLALSPTGESQATDAAGTATLFAPVGSYSVTVTPPDSFVATSPNPVSRTMANGDSATVTFGLGRTDLGRIRGKVFRDNNRNGVLDAGEGGIANVWVGVSSDGGVTVVGYQYTNATGDYDITVPVNDPPGTAPYAILAIVPAGHYPTSTTAIQPVLVRGGADLTGRNFGMLGYQVITLNASRVLSLGSGDLLEKQGADNAASNARRDADLVLGADAGGTDNISVWFNQYDNTPLFDANATYTRTAQQSVLSLSLDTLDSNSPKDRLDVVTGTKNAAAGNFFVWFNQNSGANEGYFPTSHSLAYRTADNGDVQAVLTADVGGGSGADQVDILVGTKSPTAGQGTIEIWTSSNATTPTFSRLETYPPAGAIPSNALGEVNAMALADFDGDGRRDLVVGTRTGSYSGQLLFFKNNGKSSGSSRFTFQISYPIAGAVTALAPVDVQGDGLLDVVIGVQTAVNKGQLQQWTNKTSLGLFLFDKEREVDAPGIVMALLAADFGGLSARGDLAMGWRQSETSFVGGVRIYPLDSGKLPSSGSDPSDGSVVNMVPALTASNFNYGVKPAIPPAPYLIDLAAGVKITASTGALVVFIR